MSGPLSTRHRGARRDDVVAFRSHAENNYARSLSTLIEHEIIPRLVLAHAADGPPSLAAPEVRNDITPDDVDALAPLTLQVEADALLAHVETILARGVSVDTLMVDLLAPTARRLGEYWDSDQCDFIDVTMGLWRLQEVIHEIAYREPTEKPVEGRHALFASMPGDEHSFGAIVIDEVFRLDGWATDRLSNVETPILLKRVADEWFDLIGLTISCDCHIATLTSMIAALRTVSRNGRVCVMVGGRIFIANPDLAMQVGADGTARDAKLALSVAEGLVREREREAAALS